jgi:hypothetical protein
MMIAPKMLPIVPPTIAVSRFSFWQVLTRAVAVASKGVPVETAVAATSMGSLVAVGACSWSVALKVVVTLGAVESLQQLFVSLMARQQYFPWSHVCNCHVATRSIPVDTVALLAYACDVLTFSRLTTRTHLWTCCIFSRLVRTSSLKELADRRARGSHTNSITQAGILSRAATTMLCARITWRVSVIKSRPVDTIALLTRSQPEERRKERKEGKTRHHIR